MSLARYKDLCIDAADPVALAAFWGRVLGREPAPHRDGVVGLHGDSPEQTIWFNPVPEPKTVKHRVHLDLHVASVEELVEAGATVLEGDALPWTVMADPEGGEFCAFPREGRTTCDLYEVIVDSADPARIAGWWAEVLGARLDGEGDEVALDQIPGAPFEYLVFGTVPEPKTVKNRVHLDVVVPDVEALVERGARVLDRPADRHWVVMADPEGNEFCAFST